LTHRQTASDWLYHYLGQLSGILFSRFFSGHGVYVVVLIVCSIGSIYLGLFRW